MSRHTAETALDAMTGRPAYLQEGYATAENADDMGIGVLSHMRRLATANPVQEVAAWEERKSAIMADYGMPAAANDKIFAYADGVAMIPVHGILINRFAYSWGFVTGYNFIRAQLAAALEDDDVKLIAYDVNSYGGMSAGAQETSDAIFASRKVKPSVAIVDFNCFSAAYFVMSAATKLIASPSSGVGSIGTYLIRVDVSKALETQGVKVNVLFAGARKLDQMPVVPLSKAAAARLQQTVDDANDIFIAAVVRNRKMDEEAVRATEAGCFDPPDALELGLIDSIQAPAAALEAAVSRLSDDNVDEDSPMSKTPAEVAAEATAATAAEAARAETQAQAVATASAAAVAADRARSSAILNHAEAAGKGKLAAHLAQSGVGVDEAAGILKAAAPEAPPAAPAAAPNPLEAAMAATKQPNVTGDGKAAEEGQDTPQAKAQGILAAQFKATGFKPAAAA